MQGHANSSLKPLEETEALKLARRLYTKQSARMCIKVGATATGEIDLVGQ